MEEQKQDDLAENFSPGQAAAELKEMLKDVALEIDTLDALRRTLLCGVIRQQSGIGVEEWLQAAESLETLTQAQDRPGRDANRRRQVIAMLAEWKEKLEGLETCFKMAAQLAGHYVKDPGELTGSIDVLAHRQQVVRRLITEIEQLERS